jgi:hypothetical protein
LINYLPILKSDVNVSDFAFHRKSEVPGMQRFGRNSLVRNDFCCSSLKEVEDSILGLFPPLRLAFTILLLVVFSADRPLPVLLVGW